MSNQTSRPLLCFINRLHPCPCHRLYLLQVQRLLLSFPKTSHGYQYIGISLGTALALGLLIYGVPVWTQ